ncbi:MAG TPA: hypothetical protein H9799_00955 [Candidatus Mediterraneibacter merdipullorum]|nr:hypothetical protein [Candidatus Mediterraneibacter merdipullorum]
MVDLHFSNVRGESIVFSKYILKTHNDYLFIEPHENSITKKIDPLEDIDTLIMDIIETSQVITRCKSYMSFLSKIADANIVYEKNFWKYPDFFADKNQTDASTIINAVTLFVEKYGLPDWELEKDAKAILPLEYSIYSAPRQDDNDSVEYLKTFLTAKIALGDTITYPICSLTLFFLNFLNIFTVNRTSKLKRVEHCRLYFRNEPEHKPELEAIAIGLFPSILLAFIVFTSGLHKAVHVCKHCGKHFITTDARSEYCSAKCRASYNTAQTRKRQRRKLQEMNS